MQKLVALIFLSLIGLRPALAQLYSSNTGKAHFFSEAPLENIEATTKKAQGVINPGTGQVSVRVPMKSFEFEKALMKEHFNDNYLETEKYPNATMEGKLLTPLDLTKNGVQQNTVKAMVELHGVKKEYDLPVNITIQAGAPTKAFTKFRLKIADHKIEIPTIVVKNVAEVVDVDVEFDLKPMTKK